VYAGEQIPRTPSFNRPKGRGIKPQGNKMAAGSTFEMNGRYFFLNVDTEISGFDTSAENYSSLYVYVKETSASSHYLAFGTEEPAYIPDWSAWYLGNNRALAFGYKLGDHFVVTEYIQGLRKVNQLISVAQRGYINIAYAENNIISANSAYEANGGMHGNILDIVIDGWSTAWAEGSWVYIYASDNAPNSSYYYSQTQPVRNMEKGAFYNGNDRAVAIGVKVDNEFSLINYLYPWTRL
jgi:hypothetical protein